MHIVYKVMSTFIVPKFEKSKKRSKQIAMWFSGRSSEEQTVYSDNTLQHMVPIAFRAVEMYH